VSAVGVSFVNREEERLVAVLPGVGPTDTDGGDIDHQLSGGGDWLRPLLESHIARAVIDRGPHDVVSSS
jgi:hypothetical protein